MESELTQKGNEYYNNQEYSKAVECWKVAAGNGDIQAAKKLGSYYCSKFCIPQDFKESGKWYKKVIDYWTKLAENGDAKAQHELGTIYFFGHGANKNIELAINWYTQAANQGHVESQYMLSNIYDGFMNSPKNYNLYHKWLVAAAENGHPTAQWKLGTYYERYKKDLKTAEQWHLKAAEQGELFSISWLTRKYFFGDFHFEKNYKEAFKWANKSIEVVTLKDESYKVCGERWIIGECYYNGWGVEQDFNKAFYWYLEAANLDSSMGQFMVGICYYKGHGVEQNFKNAIYWLRKADSQKYSEASYYLGLCYIENKIHDNRSLDINSGLYYLKKATKSSSADVLLKIAEIYFNEEYGVQNYEEAIFWYKEAAKYKVTAAIAKYQLGYCYQNALGVYEDVNEAKRWYQEALNDGNKMAQERLEELERLGY